MPSRRLPWVLSLPVMAAGCLAAHSVAYRLTDPPLAEAEHGYLAFAPLVLALGLALGLVRAAARHTRTGVPVQLFALLPPLAFILQEHLERALQGGDALGTALEPAFLLGLALQLPFAVCSLLVARSLCRVAEAAGAVLARRPAAPLRVTAFRRPAFIVDLPRLSPLASPQCGRAPPLPA
jgi:hypothetical protein